MFDRYINSGETRILPLSGCKYTISKSGIVTDNNNCVIKPFVNKVGELVVKIDWLEKNKEYPVALLIAHAFKPLKLHHKWWNLIRVFFADGNKNNIHPSNLVWKFPIGLGSSENNGFAFIPGHSRFLINRDGVIFDNYTKRILNASFKKGYYSYSLLLDIGQRVSIFRHRAICLAFTDYPANVDNLEVNHKDGIPGHDELSNLEWVTTSENRLHAIITGLTLVNKPVIVKNLITGIEVVYFSLAETCKQLKISEKKLSVALGQENGALRLNDLELRYENPNHALIGNLNRCPILVRDLRTGTVTEYESIISCARKTGKSKYVIAARIEHPTSELHHDYLQFKRKSDSNPWYIPADYERELLETSWTKKVEIRNILLDQVFEFRTQREAADYIGIAESTLLLWITATNQPVFKTVKDNQYIQIKRKSDLTKWRPVKDPENEYLLGLSAKPVLVRNTLTGEIKMFESAQECAKALGILTTTLNWRLKTRGQKTYQPHFQFKYKADNLPFLE